MSGALGTRAGLLYIPVALSRVQEPLIFFTELSLDLFVFFLSGKQRLAKEETNAECSV